jgi:3-oxoacyl-[acyl-carrier-protein] synthase-3
MNIPIEKFYMNLDEYGNTSSATIPLALDEMNRKGMLKKGQKIILVGFGGGLTWGSVLINWQG